MILNKLFGVISAEVKAVYVVMALRWHIHTSCEALAVVTLVSVNIYSMVNVCRYAAVLYMLDELVQSSSSVSLLHAHYIGSPP